MEKEFNSRDYILGTFSELRCLITQSAKTVAGERFENFSAGEKT